MNAEELKFTKFVRENEATIYTVCYMFSKDADEVADLFQEVLINLWKGFNSFEGRSQEKTWVYRVALNTCVSIINKKNRRKNAMAAFDFELSDDKELHVKQLEILRKRISLLNPLDRALVLLWLENLSYDEIGDIIGISAQNVAVRLFRIREKLRNMHQNDD